MNLRTLSKKWSWARDRFIIILFNFGNTLYTMMISSEDISFGNKSKLKVFCSLSVLSALHSIIHSFFIIVFVDANRIMSIMGRLSNIFRNGRPIMPSLIIFIVLRSSMAVKKRNDRVLLKVEGVSNRIIIYWNDHDTLVNWFYNVFIEITLSHVWVKYCFAAYFVSFYEFYKGDVYVT